MSSSLTALSPKRVADYVELISSHLDCIPVGTLGFESVIHALLQIGTHEESTTELEGKLKSLQNMLTHPEDYAEPVYQAEFKALVIDRVHAKAKELLSMEAEEKTRYLEEQEQRQQASKSSQEALRLAAEATSNAAPNTLSEDEWLTEIQASFQNESSEGDSSTDDDSSLAEPLGSTEGDSSTDDDSSLAGPLDMNDVLARIDAIQAASEGIANQFIASMSNVLTEADFSDCFVEAEAPEGADATQEPPASEVPEPQEP